jgi:hypothetical protein
VKCDPEPRGVRPRRAQQPGRLVGRRAELARQIVDCPTLRQSQPHQQPQGRRVADQSDRHRLLQNFRQLVGAVEREVGHIVTVKGVADRRPRFDRVHEMDLGRRQQLAHELHLGERGAVEMPDAAGPERPQNTRLGVALDGIKDIAGEAVDKNSRGAGDYGRTQAQ